jgi:hypothetical protein
VPPGNYVTTKHIVALIVWRLYNTGWIDNWIYWITHNYSVYALTAHYSSLAESSHCIFTRCLSSNIAGSVRLQLCNASLNTAARPKYSLVTRNCNSLSTNCNWLTEDSSYIASWPDPKENTSTLLCQTRPHRKQQPSHCCISGWGQTT